MNYIKKIARIFGIKKPLYSINLNTYDFYKTGDFFLKHGAKFVKSADEDDDNKYRDFEYKGEEYTLHWNNYLGVEVLYYSNKGRAIINNLILKIKNKYAKENQN